MTEKSTGQHLAANELELQFTEFELVLIRTYASFTRWEEACQSCVDRGADLNANEIALLHAIRIQETPKTLIDLGRILNRDDTSNLQYSLRKLQELDLISSVSIQGKKNAYAITEIGKHNTDSYQKIREELLFPFLEEEFGLDKLVRKMKKIKIIYDEAIDQVAIRKAYLDKEILDE